VMKTSSAFMQLGRGKGPNLRWCKVVPGIFSKKWSGLRVPSANRSMDLGREMEAFQEPNPRVRGVGQCLT
jgi:hypothetical protein